MLWSGLVSWVDSSKRVNFIAPLPLGQNCPRRIGIAMTVYIFLMSCRKFSARTNQRVSQSTNGEQNCTAMLYT